MKTYNRLIIDINKEITDIVTAKQNDTLSRYLDITLVDGGVPIDLTGHEVRFYARKADGNVIYNTAQLTDATKGRCQIELTSQALAVAQDLSCELTIYKDNKEILSTKAFVIHVDKTLRNDEAVESSNEYGALVVLYQNLHESYLLMQDMIQKIGVPMSNAQSLNLDTMYKIWDYMIQYLKDNSSAGVVDVVNTINSKVGAATDTGGSTIAGTVMGKLNKLQKKTVYSPFGTLKRTLLTTPYAPTTSEPYKFCNFEAKYDGSVRITVSITAVNSDAPSTLNIYRSNHCAENYPFSVVAGSSDEYSRYPRFNEIFTAPEGSKLQSNAQSSRFGCMNIIVRGSITKPYDIIVPVSAGEKVSFVFHSYAGDESDEYASSIKDFKLYYDEAEV